MASKELDHDSTEESGFLLDEGQSKKFTINTKRRSVSPVWLIIGLLFTLLLGSILINIMQHLRYQKLFQTDLSDARKVIEYEQRKFTGALVYDEETKRAIRLKDAPIEYFGPPGETDAAWDELLKGEFIEMTEEEAEPYTPELRTLPPNDVYKFELDVTHSLHCLNGVRMEMNKVLYPNSSHQSHDHNLGNMKFPDGWDIAHMEHCMDRIRQALMCHADLAPSPLYRWDGFNIAFGRTGEHTCRKWEPIREWLDERKRRDDAKDHK